MSSPPKTRDIGMEDCSIEGGKKTVLEVWPEVSLPQKKVKWVIPARWAALPVTYGVITPINALITR